MSRIMTSRKFAAIVMLILLMVTLTGCSPPNKQGSTTEDLLQGGFWSHYAVFPLSWMLDFLADSMWGSYGLAIIVLTIIVRFLVLPLTLKQYRSSKAMQALQPELKKIKEKNKDNPQKQQEETMKLFQQHGVNPLAGCLPLVVQMPVLIALYNAIYWNADIKTHTFLIFELGQKDPTFILPILAATTTFIQQRLMMKQTPSQMKALMFIFPVLIFVMSMQFAAALPLYWIFSNLFTIGQTYFIYGGSSNKGGLSK